MDIRRILLALLSVLVLASFTSSTWSAPTWKERVEAKKLMDKGTAAAKAASWQEAREAYQAALDLHDSSRARKGLANAFYHLSLLLEAREHAQIVADNKQVGWWDRKHCKELLKKIEAELPHFTIRPPSGFSGTIRVDDVPWDDKLGTRTEANPGSIVVTAESEGFVPYKQSVVLVSGADEVINIVLENVPEPPPVVSEGWEVTSDQESSTQPIIGYVSLAVGGVGLIAGTAFGLAARNHRNELDNACVNDVCDKSQRDTYNQGKMQANGSTAGFLVGGIGLGLGTLLLLTSPKDLEPKAVVASVKPYLGPTGAGVAGVF